MSKLFFPGSGRAHLVGGGLQLRAQAQATGSVTKSSKLVRHLPAVIDAFHTDQCGCSDFVRLKHASLPFVCAYAVHVQACTAS